MISFISLLDNNRLSMSMFHCPLETLPLTSWNHTALKDFSREESFEAARKEAH